MKKTRYIILLLLSFILFAFTAKAQFIKLHDFNQTDGAHPYNSLISDSTFLYGMTGSGGQDSLGNIFKIKPNGTGFVDLFDFNGVNGANPAGALTLSGSYLYGVTTYGGTYNKGVIFKIKKDGTGFTVLFNFDGNDGKYPLASLKLDGAFLYGTASEGGINNVGSIFKIKKDGTGFTDMFNFNDTISGGGSHSQLISDGTFLYGTTSYGPNNNCGSIFKIKPDGTDFTQILIFNGNNSCSPLTGLVSDGTFLYGTTMGNGYPNNEGTLFKIKPNGTGFSTLFTFILTNNGTAAPYGVGIYGSLIIDSAYLYGMTYSGGANNQGVVFKIKKNGTSFTDMLNFTYTTGTNPHCTLVTDGTFLYGTTNGGGVNNMGTIFKLGLSANGINKYDNNNENISVYPNPAANYLNIRDKNNTAYSLQIYSLTGKLLIEKDIDKPLRLNISGFANGIYFISIENKQGVTVAHKKFVVLH